MAYQVIIERGFEKVHCNDINCNAVFPLEETLYFSHHYTSYRTRLQMCPKCHRTDAHYIYDNELNIKEQDSGKRNS